MEVKGSVELAPLTGLVDGIVDLTASGRTLRENHLEVVEEIVDCTARLIANPVAHKLKAAEIDALVEGMRSSVRVRRVMNAWSRPGAGGSVERDVREDPRPCPAPRRRRGARLSAFDRAELRPTSCAWTRGARGIARRARARRAAWPARGHRKRAGRGEAQLAEPAAVELDAGQRVEVASGRCARWVCTCRADARRTRRAW